MLDTKTPGRPQPTCASTTALLAHYNSQVDAYNVAIRVKFGDDENKIASMLQATVAEWAEGPEGRESLIESIKRQNLRLGRVINQRSHELLLEKVKDPESKDGLARNAHGYTVGLTYQQILGILATEFPEASTSVACLRWYNVHMKADATDEGKPYPDLPQYRPRSSALKAAA